MFKYQRNFIKNSNEISKIIDLSISPNQKRIAVVNTTKQIILFDQKGEKRDKISTRGAIKGNDNYMIRSIEFSPNSEILAVAQSDNIIYGYKLGQEWGDRKSICTKIPTKSPVTAMVWPRQKQYEIIFGVSSGQIRIGFVKNHKSQSLYQTNSYPVSISLSPSGNHLISGHLDNSIYLYSFDSQTFRKIHTTTCVPYSLAYGQDIVYAGNDSKITFIGHSGNIVQVFDMSNEKNLRDFECAQASPNGQSIILANYSKFYLYSYHSTRQEWEMKQLMNINNYYQITSLAWSQDSSQLLTGTINGSVDLFDMSLKKVCFRSEFIVTYITKNKVKIQNLKSAKESIFEGTQEIYKVNILKGRYFLGNTQDTMILGDCSNGHQSKINWGGRGVEKFIFQDNVILIINAGEVSLINLGEDDVKTSIRSDFTNNNQLSGVYNEEHQRLAYLIDQQNIQVINLNKKINNFMIQHQETIISLSFNARGNRILFKDNKKRLFIYCINSQVKTMLMNWVGFYQWIPSSDVILAQNNQSLQVWYSSENVNKKDIIPVNGQIIGVETGKEVIVEVMENNKQKKIQLDTLLVHFSFAAQKGDLSQCLKILDQRKDVKNRAYWQTVLDIAMRKGSYFVVERCFTALNDFSKAHFFRNLNKKIRKGMRSGQEYKEAVQDYQVQAQLSIFKRDFKKAERILIENDQIDQAIEMYQDLQRWEESLKIVEKFKPNQYDQMRLKYMQWLSETDQEEKAGEFVEKKGLFREAMQFYLKANLPVRASKLISKENLKIEDQLVVEIIQMLRKYNCFGELGRIMNYFGDTTKALNYFIKGKCFDQAVNLAKQKQPELVTKLQEKWGDFCVAENRRDQSVKHFIEAGCIRKALESCIESLQLSKALQLIDSLSGSEKIEYSLKLAKKLEKESNYEMAQKLYIQADRAQDAVLMYLKSFNLGKASSICDQKLGKEKRDQIFKEQALKKQEEGHYDKAEAIYLEINQPERAIKMYKSLQQWDKMLHLFQVYRPEHLKEAHGVVAKKFESKEDLRRAEKHYLEAGRWNLAVEMFEKRKMFEEALRICKNYASDRDTVERAKRWDVMIGEERLIELLQKMYLLDSLIDYLCEKGRFEEAFNFCEVQQHKKVDVHLNYAIQLEDNHNYQLAENHYIKAFKYDQAVLMFTEIQDFQSAINLAKKYDQSLLSQIYEEQGKFHLTNGDYEKMEIAFINGQNPQAALEGYLKINNFKEALRVAKKYCYEQVGEIQRKLEINQNIGSMGFEELIQQAQIWEDNHQWDKALDIYLMVDKEMAEEEILKKIWDKAINIAQDEVHHRLQEVVCGVCGHLEEMGDYEMSGQYYEVINMREKAALCYMQSQKFEKAKENIEKIMKMEKRKKMESIYKKHYHVFLRERGKADDLINEDKVDKGLEILVERRDWAQVFEIAEREGVLRDYQIKYFKILEQEMDYHEFLELFNKFKLDIQQSDYELINRVIQKIIKIKNFTQFMEIFKILKKFPKFQKMAKFSYFMGLFQLYKENNLNNLLKSVCINLLRYSDVLGHAKMYLKVGKELKKIKEKYLAFLILNRYLDIYEAFKGGQKMLENREEFKIVDFQISELSQEILIKEEQKEKIKDWLLKIALKESQEISFPTRECSNCSEQIFVDCLECPFCSYQWQMCYVSGIPLLRSQIQCDKCNHLKDQENYEIFGEHFGKCLWMDQ